MIATAATAASSHDVRPGSLDALKNLGRGSSRWPSRGLGGVMCEM
jgi:hypothetical protein